MLVIVISKEDPASINIRDQLIKDTGWELSKDLKFDDNEMYFYKDNGIMVTINKYHLYHDDLDISIQDELNNYGYQHKISAIAFASKHRSASGMRTLTVHPIGNYNKADYGGKPCELVPSAPHVMTDAMRLLYKNASMASLDYSVTFEVTHHGPYLETPSFFIEIGSDETAWGDFAAGQAIARTLLSLLAQDVQQESDAYPVAIGIGGGHYAPRHSDVARKKRISFGHMVPNYIIDSISMEQLKLATENTPGVELVYFHRKALKKDKYRDLKAWFEDLGFRVVRFDDLDNLDDL
jgi:D-aminoacyl-tRNA deacylase